jgi:hypothetical protein
VRDRKRECEKQSEVLKAWIRLSVRDAQALSEVSLHAGFGLWIAVSTWVIRI